MAIWYTALNFVSETVFVLPVMLSCSESILIMMYQAIQNIRESYRHQYNQTEMDVNELRGFASLGILELWNGGIMSLKEFHQIRFYFTDFVTHHSSIPIFHYSVWKDGLKV